MQREGVALIHTVRECELEEFSLCVTNANCMRHVKSLTDGKLQHNVFQRCRFQLLVFS